MTLDRLAAAVGLPRSTAYHLVTAMIEEGFVVHLAEEHRYGLGVAAFEVGSGYARQEPLQRIARRQLAALVDAVGQSAHLAVLHGRDVLYVLEERAPGRPPLVTDVGVRLPAHLTASGRAILAALPAAQVRALFPDRTAFVDRHGVGPDVAERAADPARARPGSAATRSRRARSRPGSPRVAAAVLDHNGHPVAGVAVTYPVDAGVDVDRAVRATQRCADTVTRRLGGTTRRALNGPADPCRARTRWPTMPTGRRPARHDGQGLRMRRSDHRSRGSRRRRRSPDGGRDPTLYNRAGRLRRPSTRRRWSGCRSSSCSCSTGSSATA